MFYSMIRSTTWCKELNWSKEYEFYRRKGCDKYNFIDKITGAHTQAVE